MTLTCTGLDQRHIDERAAHEPPPCDDAVSASSSRAVF